MPLYLCVDGHGKVPHEGGGPGARGATGGHQGLGRLPGGEGAGEGERRDDYQDNERQEYQDHCSKSSINKVAQMRYVKKGVKRVVARLLFQ